MKRKRRKKERAFYRFAVPIVMFVSTAAAVLIWNYTATVFGDRFFGYAAAGMTGEVALEFFKEPAVILVTLGVLVLTAAAAASIAGAMKEGQSGASLLLILLLITLALYSAIIYTAIVQIAS